MHWRRFASFILGAWMFGLFAAAYYVSANFGSASRVLEKPAEPASAILQALGEERSRLILSHMAGEQNRYFLARFETAEIALGLTLTASLLFATHTNRLAAVLAGAMTAITLFLRLFIGPELAYLGRQLDFAADSAATGPGGTLWTLRLTYSGLAIVKALMGAALTWYLMTYKTRFRHAQRSGAAQRHGADAF